MIQTAEINRICLTTRVRRTSLTETLLEVVTAQEQANPGRASFHPIGLMIRLRVKFPMWLLTLIQPGRQAGGANHRSRYAGWH